MSTQLVFANKTKHQKALTHLPKITFDQLSSVNGKKWSTGDLKGKAVYLLYVDPDKKDYNSKLGNTIRDLKFPKEHYAAVAVINMKATIIPNFFLNSGLKDKQKEYPNVTYIKDFDKRLVKEWGYHDDDYVISLFDHTGKLLFYQNGELNEKQTKRLLASLKTAVSSASKANR